MTVIADIAIPSGEFELGRVFNEHPDITIDLERIVPLGDTVIPLFWVTNGNPDAIESTLLDSPHAEIARNLTDAGERVLFEVRWNFDDDGIIQPLIDTNARVLEATGNAEEWEFRIRFSTQEDFNQFNRTVTNKGIPVTLRHIYNPVPPDEQSPLSDEQRKAITEAYRRGYFNIPREVTAADLAKEFEVSDSALSERLRRGLSTVVRETVIPDEERQ
jgi:predicted DNA binding protein